MNEKKELLMQAAIRLFANEGVAVPTAKIAKEAGVSNGTLFNNFASKQVLIDEVYLTLKQQMAESLLIDISPEQTTKELLSTVWYNYVVWGVQNPTENEVVALLRSANALSPEVVAQGESIFASTIELFQKAIEAGEVRYMPMDYVCEMAAAHMNVSVAFAIRHNLSDQQLAEHVTLSFDIFWKGITP